MYKNKWLFSFTINTINFTVQNIFDCVLNIFNYNSKLF